VDDDDDDCLFDDLWKLRWLMVTAAVLMLVRHLAGSSSGRQALR
jgi:hypothetical protein